MEGARIRSSKRFLEGFHPPLGADNNCCYEAEEVRRTKVLAKPESMGRRGEEAALSKKDCRWMTVPAVFERLTDLPAAHLFCKFDELRVEGFRGFRHSPQRRSFVSFYSSLIAC